ncbi:hypothetical protein BKA62DRAFT_721974 [Auriculariales sp. MPI-PUGE-AT-0066]|nr:hypothetical protein BKA62DRAFT_721974 [Auriculariales sp. MPI-PUGE-AT-0066]
MGYPMPCQSNGQTLDSIPSSRASKRLPVGSRRSMSMSMFLWSNSASTTLVSQDRVPQPQHLHSGISDRTRDSQSETPIRRAQSGIPGQTDDTSSVSAPLRPMPARLRLSNSAQPAVPEERSSVFSVALLPERDTTRTTRLSKTATEPSHAVFIHPIAATAPSLSTKRTNGEMSPRKRRVPPPPVPIPVPGSISIPLERFVAHDRVQTPQPAWLSLHSPRRASYS